MTNIVVCTLRTGFPRRFEVGNFCKFKTKSPPPIPLRWGQEIATHITQQMPVRWAESLTQIAAFSLPIDCLISGYCVMIKVIEPSKMSPGLSLTTP